MRRRLARKEQRRLVDLDRLELADDHARRVREAREVVADDDARRAEPGRLDAAAVAGRRSGCRATAGIDGLVAHLLRHVAGAVARELRRRP